MGFDIESYLSRKKELIDGKMKLYLGVGDDSATNLGEAMMYSALAGGKRLRPILMIAANEAVGGDVETVLPAACASNDNLVNIDIEPIPPLV